MSQYWMDEYTKSCILYFEQFWKHFTSKIWGHAEVQAEPDVRHLSNRLVPWTESRIKRLLLEKPTRGWRKNCPDIKVNTESHSHIHVWLPEETLMHTLIFVSSLASITSSVSHQNQQQFNSFQCQNDSVSATTHLHRLPPNPSAHAPTIHLPQVYLDSGISQEAVNHRLITVKEGEVQKITELWFKGGCERGDSKQQQWGAQDLPCALENTPWDTAISVIFLFVYLCCTVLFWI